MLNTTDVDSLSGEDGKNAYDWGKNQYATYVKHPRYAIQKRLLVSGLNIDLDTLYL
jgi:hypothetical protein